MIVFLMAAILHSASVDNEKLVERSFLPYQLDAIYHESRKRLAEKAVRVGYTYAKAFRVVRNSIQKRKHTSLFTSKDQGASFEFVENCEEHIELFDHARSVILKESTDESVPVYDDEGKDTGTTEKVTMSKIVFDNGSRILAFSSNPNALRSYGGDVYWDEAAFHKKGKQMWSAAQGRARMGYNIDVWSSLEMEDTMFDVLAALARAAKGGWDYARVDIYDAVEQGLVELINKWRGTQITREQFINEAKEDAVLPDLFALEYEIKKSNTLAPIVGFEVLKAAEKAGHKIERAHLTQSDIETLFGRAEIRDRGARRRGVETWMSMQFPDLFKKAPGSRRYRIGFDVAASRKGDLASYWVDERVNGKARHRALLTFRTEDWDVLEWCGQILMARLPGEVVGRGDETGLGRQICWNLSKLFYGRFEGVNFSARKSDIGVALMSQLAAHRSELSPDHPDITQDLYCIRKGIKEDRVYFFESKNDLLPASHADIGWSAALAAYADLDQSTDVWVMPQT